MLDASWQAPILASIEEEDEYGEEEFFYPKAPDAGAFGHRGPLGRTTALGPFGSQLTPRTPLSGAGEYPAPARGESPGVISPGLPITGFSSLGAPHAYGLKLLLASAVGKEVEQQKQFSPRRNSWDGSHIATEDDVGWKQEAARPIGHATMDQPRRRSIDIAEEESFGAGVAGVWVAEDGFADEEVAEEEGAMAEDPSACRESREILSSLHMLEAPIEEVLWRAKVQEELTPVNDSSDDAARMDVQGTAQKMLEADSSVGVVEKETVSEGHAKPQPNWNCDENRNNMEEQHGQKEGDDTVRMQRNVAWAAPSSVEKADSTVGLQEGRSESRRQNRKETAREVHPKHEPNWNSDENRNNMEEQHAQKEGMASTNPALAEEVSTALPCSEISFQPPVASTWHSEDVAAKDEADRTDGFIAATEPTKSILRSATGPTKSILSFGSTNILPDISSEDENDTETLNGLEAMFSEDDEEATDGGGTVGSENKRVTVEMGPRSVVPTPAVEKKFYGEGEGPPEPASRKADSSTSLKLEQPSCGLSESEMFSSRELFQRSINSHKDFLDVTEEDKEALALQEIEEKGLARVMRIFLEADPENPLKQGSISFPTANR